MDVKRKLILTAVGVAAVASVSSGIAYAQTGPGPTDTTPPGATNGPNTQQGDHNDSEKPDANEPPEAAGQDKDAEPANDPDHGHQDPNGVDVDHNAPGEQPEPTAPGAVT